MSDTVPIPHARVTPRAQLEWDNSHRLHSKDRIVQIRSIKSRDYPAQHERDGFQMLSGANVKIRRSLDRKSDLVATLARANPCWLPACDGEKNVFVPPDSWSFQHVPLLRFTPVCRG
ncbi:hypothetical protein PQR39_40745 [Paraburkholderia sediminicola]|uniref:hypothetical protein n=1 Tax=Paraburkholderia sediminicola TaxID=458836 RepID=UPI0038BB08CF